MTLRASSAPALAWVLLFSPAISSAIVIRVPADQPTIQQGINAAQPGDQVLVAPGTYSGANNVNLDFLGKDIAVVSEAGPQSTTINGQGGAPGFNLHSNETEAALIEGFTIQNGAGGILLNPASPTIRNCAFIGNATSGLTIQGVDQSGGPFPFVTLEDCVFTGNSGAGLRLISASGAMSDCEFMANNGWGIIMFSGFWGSGAPRTLDRCTISANMSGGIDVVNDGQAVLRDCLISDHAANSGRGMRDGSEHGRSQFYRCTFRRNLAGAFASTNFQNRGSYFEDCTFEENSAPKGAAISMSMNSDNGVDVQRCRFINNSATQSGGAIHSDEGRFIIENSVFWNNLAGEMGGAIGVNGGLVTYVTLRSCTIAGGGAPLGGGIGTALGARFTLDRTIIAFTGSGTALSCGLNSFLTIATCSDLFGNAGGDWVGDCVAGLNGTNGNISADPGFCGFPVGDLTLAAGSPCAPEHSGTCGLIGALPVACGVTSVEPGVAPVTWGRVKAQFHR